VAAVDAAFADQPLAELLPRLARVGVPAGEVRTLDRVYDWDQTRSQGLLVDVDHATAGTITLPGPPLRFDAHAPRTHQAPPTLGQHDESVRQWLDDVEAAPPARK
jgi:crotonobetainyl-CoA:carnitine CoA-transferase CaiB-like acyl-CoA transferase